MSLKTFNDKLKAIGLYDKYKDGSAQAAGGSGGLTPGASTEAQQITQTGLLTSILSAIGLSQDFEAILVKDTSTEIVYKQIITYDQGTGAVTITYQDASGTVVPTPPGPLELLDPSAVLNMILTELQNIKVDTEEVNTDMDCKPTYYFSLDGDSFGASAPAFPFTVNIFDWSRTTLPPGSISYPIAPTVVNDTTELAALWNANVPGAELIARDARTLYFLNKAGDTWNFSAADSISFGDTGSFGLLSYRGDLPNTWYKDIALHTSNLDTIKELILNLYESGLATSAKQDAIITELQAILAEPDYELVHCYGRDSDQLQSFTAESGSVVSTLVSGPTGPPPLVVVNPSLDQITIVQSNNSYAVEFDIDVDLSGTNLVNVLIDWEITNAPTFPAQQIQFELIETGGATVLDTVNASGLPAFPPTSGTVSLSYDNSSTNYPEFRVRIRQSTIADSNLTVVYNGFNLLSPAAQIPNPAQAIIRRVDKYEDNLLVSTEYFDYQDNPYTLVGTFVKDHSLFASQTLNDVLAQITTNTVELQKLTSHNTFSEELLPQAALSDLYTNFKELTFTVISGTVDVTVGAGSPITYPVGPVTGNTYTADNISATAISIDRTNGDYLVTVKT